MYTLRTTTESVEVWSTARLPFEPAGWLRDLRQDISKAVKGLRPRSMHILYGVYACESSGWFDLENVLFYNVGVGCFAALSRKGLRFEAGPSVPPAPNTISSRMPHYYCYTQVPHGGSFEHWKVRSRIATWTDAVIPPLNSTTRASSVWHAVRSGPISEVALPKEDTTRFGLSVTLAVPNSAARNLLPLVKPLLDGVIAAFHAHDGTTVEILARRISDTVSQSPRSLIALLVARDRAVLGTRRLLWLWRDTVQWNPADDRCVAADIRVECREIPVWTLSGDLFTVDPAVPHA